MLKVQYIKDWRLLEGVGCKKQCHILHKDSWHLISVGIGGEDEVAVVVAVMLWGLGKGDKWIAWETVKMSLEANPGRLNDFNGVTSKGNYVYVHMPATASPIINTSPPLHFLFYPLKWFSPACERQGIPYNGKLQGIKKKKEERTVWS